MGNRLSKIYTRTGDSGTTGMADGSRIDKDSTRIRVLGDVDELNSVIGIVISESDDDKVREMLFTIQHDLFNLGAELSMPGYEQISEQRVAWLEQRLDAMNEDLPPLKEFILPGGGKGAAYCHLARAVCRRAERTLVTLARESELSDWLVAYVNRLSDLLFVVCRVLSRSSGGAEIYWQSERIRS